ncbi:MAG: InlB B-repeat-containing protein, partial [Clostridia bacterium]|nr:InlB B-repeat-containing protein [Clostridia bacterium]
GTVGDITVTAKPWSIVSYKITYNNNVASTSASKTVTNSNPTTYTVEDAITFAPATRSGYDFVAWDRNIEKGTTGAITVNASWDVIDYTITYDLSDTGFAYEAVNSELNPTTYTVEDKVTFSNPTCTGYTFNGWNITSIAKGTIGDKTITAKAWSIVSYKITYNNNIASDSASKAVTNSNPATYTVEDAITFVPATRSGYNFGTWDRNIEKGTTGAITVNASWSIVTYSLEYDLNDSNHFYSTNYDDSNPTTYTVEDSVTFSNPTSTGYTFNGWDTPAIAKGTVGDKKLTALWTAINYTINYNYNVASDSASKTVVNSNPATYTVEDAISFVSASRSGYDFVEWDRGIERGTVGEVNVNATWSIVTYSIEYDLNDSEHFYSASNSALNPTTYTVEDRVVFESPTNKGYTFTAWTNATIAKGSVGDKQTSAVWNAIRYKISYEYNIADDSASKTVQNSNPATYTVEDAITFVPATRSGYNFG